MPVDPCFEPLLADPKSHLRPPRPGASLHRYRQALDAPLAADIGPQLHAVEELVARGRGPEIAIRLYRPIDATALPVILFCHGGGFVIGSRQTHDGLCRRLAKFSGAAVASIEYRLAPEHPHPAALEDCVAAFSWIMYHGAGLGLDTDRVAICGDSAGAYLAVATALSAEASGHPPCHLGLLYPAVDPRCGTASMAAFAVGYLLTAQAMRWFWSSYMGRPAEGGHDDFSLLQRDLSGIKAATVITAEYDPLRDEGEALAHQLRRAGVHVIGRRFLGMIHGFGTLRALTPAADRALSDIAADICVSFRHRADQKPRPPTRQAG